MKFIVSSAVLQKQLSVINGVIMSNPIVPILENFLFELEEGKLKVSASDLNVSMVTEVPVESTDSGRIAVPARILLDTLKSLPEQPVTFDLDEENLSIEINANNGRYKVAGESAEDFPKIPSSEDATTSLDIPSNVIGNAIANTLFAVGTDELRPAMTGVYVNLTNENTTFVATDGHRLIKYIREDLQVEEEMTMIIPKKALNLLKGSLPQDPVGVKAEFNSNNAFFAFENVRLVSRLIDETFPDYENAIPVDNPNVLTIDRSEFLNSLKRLDIFANKTTHQIRLRLEQSRLQVFAEDLDFSNEANESLLCDFQGEDMEIGFNARFLIEMVSNLTAKELTLSLSTPSRAGIIRPRESADQENILMLVMPVMLNQYAEEE